jgi:8-oxo-dGTP pyrophosphatase MutT (NUDIX family)
MDFNSITKHKILTLIFLLRNNQILLGLKKRGFGMGKWNGFGGKVERGESIYESAKRELIEECCLTPTNLKFIGFITFKYDIEEKPLQVNVFTSDSFEGEMKETEEMKPQWFDISDLPYDQMWADDKYWYPLMFENKQFYANFLFKGYDEIVSYSVQEVSENELIDMHQKIVNYPL